MNTNLATRETLEKWTEYNELKERKEVLKALLFGLYYGNPTGATNSISAYEEALASIRNRITHLKQELGLT